MCGVMEGRGGRPEGTRGGGGGSRGYEGGRGGPASRIEKYWVDFWPNTQVKGNTFPDEGLKNGPKRSRPRLRRGLLESFGPFS